jgi:hypothetical protein
MIGPRPDPRDMTEQDFSRRLDYVGLAPAGDRQSDTVYAVRTLLSQAGHEISGPTVFYAAARLMLSLRSNPAARAEFLRLCGLG